MINYDVEPIDCGRDIIIPLVKNLDSHVMNIGNYRDITLYTIISKVFELLTKDFFSNKLFLHNSNLISGVNQVVSSFIPFLHYAQLLINYMTMKIRAYYTATPCALDILKAFDTFYGLLTMLIDRIFKMHYCDSLC